MRKPLAILLSFLLLTGLFVTLFSLKGMPEILPVQAQEPEIPISTIGEVADPIIVFTETDSYVALNNSMFYIEFYKGSTGYNKIYNIDGEVLVYDERLTLEYYRDLGQGSWNQRGIPTSISYTQYSDWHYSVERYYTDYISTSFTVRYDVESCRKIKSTITINSGQTDLYRLVWSPSGITQNAYTYGQNSITFGDSEVEHGWVGFDWEDVYSQFGGITATTISNVAQGRKVDITFDIGEIQAGQQLVVDPSIAGTSTSITALNYNFQRSLFYANSRYWVIYSDGANIVYVSSTDGTSWEAKTTMRSSGQSGVYFGSHFDGANVHYAYSYFGYNQALTYRKGTPQSNGTITWIAAEQTVLAANATAKHSEMTLNVNASGYPWIGYSLYTNASYVTPWVVSSDNNDGTWSTTAGFPYKLDATVTGGYVVQINPLSTGDVAVLWCGGVAKIEAAFWNGTDWSATVESTGTARTSTTFTSTVNSADLVLIGFTNSENPNRVGKFTTYNTTSNAWGAETTVVSGRALHPTPSITVDTSNDEIYVFFGNATAGTETVYYNYFDGTSWSGETSLAVEVSLQDEDVTSYRQVWNSEIGVAWLNGTASPYQVRFMTLAAGDTTEPTYSALTTSTTVSGASCDLGITCDDDTDLTVTGGYILDFNGENTTWAAFTSTPETLSETVTLTNTVGASDSYNWFFNDTAGNWNSTGAQSITLTADSYTVTLSPSSTSLYRGDTVTISVSVARDEGVTVSSWEANITRSGSLVYENYAATSFASSEDSDTTHVFDVTGLTDSDASTSVTPTCADVNVVWSGSRPAGSSSSSSSPTQPSPTPSPTTPSTVPTNPTPPMTPVEVDVPIPAIIVGVCAVGIIGIVIYVDQSRQSGWKKLGASKKKVDWNQ